MARHDEFATKADLEVLRKDIAKDIAQLETKIEHCAESTKKAFERPAESTSKDLERSEASNKSNLSAEFARVRTNIILWIVGMGIVVLGVHALELILGTGAG